MVYSQINFSLENIMNKKQIRTIFLFPVETRKAIEINEDNERTYCKMVVQKISKSLEDDECGNASNPGRMRWNSIRRVCHCLPGFKKFYSITK